MKKNLLFLFNLLILFVLQGGVCRAAEVTTWEKVDPSSLNSGDIVVIVDQNTTKAMSNNGGTSSAPTATAVTLSDDKSKITSEVSSAIQWVVTVEEGSYKFGVEGTSDYLYCTNTNNGVRVGTNANNAFTIYDNSGVNFLLNTGTSRYVGAYNSQDWRCYTSINANIKDCVTTFYKKNVETSDEPVNPSVSFASESLSIEVGSKATNTLSKPSDLNVTYTSGDTSVATVDETTGEVTGVAVGTATITATWAAVADTYNAGSVAYTVTVTEAVAKPVYKKVSGISSLAEGDVFIIVSTTSSGNYAMSNDNGASSAPTAVSMTVEEDAIKTDVTNILWTIEKSGDAYVFHPNGSTDKWLYTTATNNGVRVGDNSNKAFIVSGNYLFNNATSRYLGVYNNADWRCYTAANGNIANQTIAFFALDDGTTQEAGLAYAETTISKNVSDDAFINPLTNPHNLTITYTSSNEAVATVDADGLVTLVGGGTTTITATSAATEGYRAGSAAYTLTVTAPLTSIPALQAAVTSTSTQVDFTFTDIQVTAINGSQAYICDQNGYGALIYTEGHGLTAGQVINGTTSFNLVLYRGATEITGFSAEGLTITDGEVAPSIKTIGDITTANQSSLVTLQNVTCSVNGNTTTLSDGTNTITYYNTFGVEETLIDGGIYNITGIIVLYNSTIEIAPRTAADIELIASKKNATATFAESSVTMNIGDTHTNTVTLEPADLAVTYTSSEPTIATVNEEGLVTALALGSTTITISWEEQTIGEDTYRAGSASYTVSVTQESLNTDYYAKLTDISSLYHEARVLIVNESASKAMGAQSSNNRSAASVTIADNHTINGTSDEVQKLTIETVVEDGTTYYYFLTDDGYLYAASSSSNHLKTQTTKNDNSKAAISIADGNASIVFQGSYSRNLLRYNNSSNGLFSCYSSGQQPVQIYIETEKPDPITVNMTIGTAKYSTFIAPFDVEIPEGVKATKVSGLNGQALVEDEVEITIPANTPVVLFSETPVSETFSGISTASADSYTVGLLTGVYTATPAPVGSYVLQNQNDAVAFYVVAEGKQPTVGANRAYLTAPAGTEVKALNFSGEATGIGCIESIQADLEHAVVYNLNGQRVSHPTKGLYIVNGKKVMIP